jgi:hypothetical protein
MKASILFRGAGEQHGVHPEPSRTVINKMNLGGFGERLVRLGNDIPQGFG